VGVLVDEVHSTIGTVDYGPRTSDSGPPPKECAMLNRSVAILTAKKPFHDWLKSLPEPAELTLDEVNEDGIAYLLPELEEDQSPDDLVALCFDIMFEEELAAWTIEEEQWPKARDLATFQSWFGVSFRSIVLDLVDAKLKDTD
jgi:hypothetical protein